MKEAALERILEIAQEHPAFDQELFEKRDMEAICEVGGQVADWTIIAIIAADALKGEEKP